MSVQLRSDHADPEDTAARQIGSTLPLVVDLDGTLIATDTLVESAIRAVKRSPLDFFRLPLWLWQGRAQLKRAMADKGPIDIARLPYNQPLLSYLRNEKARGRRIILATAAHETIAREICAHLDLFDDVLASDGQVNLKGSAKLEAIRARLGPDFVYAGDSPADIPIWKASGHAILVGLSPARAAEAAQWQVQVEQEFPRETASPRVWLKALRVHQWLKNLLLFVPLLTSFSFTDMGKLLTVAGAFLVFSLAASATYIVNDLWDLDSDRAHPRKRLRPFASGTIPVSRGLAVAGFALAAALAFAWALSTGFLVMLLAYVVLTSAYSLILKRYVLIDVLMLAGLYTFRIITGAVVANIAVTSWLLAFSFFLFLSLALVKRCSELHSLRHAGEKSTSGRDYRVADLAVLEPLGVGSALSSVVVFGLFISAPETQARYATPHLLWLVAVGLVYWLGRQWIKTARGEMHDDPLIFGLKDRGSRVVGLAMVLITVAAHYVTLGMMP